MKAFKFYLIIILIYFSQQLSWKSINNKLIIKPRLIYLPHKFYTINNTNNKNYDTNAYENDFGNNNLFDKEMKFVFICCIIAGYLFIYSIYLRSIFTYSFNTELLHIIYTKKVSLIYLVI